MRSRLLAPGILGVLFVLAATLVLQAASPLPPGSVLVNPVVGTPPFYTLGPVPPNYSNLIDVLISPYTGGISGTVTSFVFQDPVTGFLAFAYRFSNATLGTGTLPAIVAASIGDAAAPWLGTTIIDAGSDSSGISTPAPLTPAAVWTLGDPFALERDNNADGAGVAIDWRVLNRGTQIDPGQFSALIWFATRTSNFQEANVGLTGTQGAVATARALAPFIPEPATLVLWGLGFGVLGLVVWRRKT